MNLNVRALVAELVGTFVLALVVRLSLTASLPLPTPVLAGLALALSVYAIGSISGAHINPAVTISLLSIGKISAMDAIAYIIAQCLGGFLALAVGRGLVPTDLALTVGNTPLIGLCEALGAALLVWAVSSVVHKKAPADAAGLTIGTGLTLGILIASVGSNGVLNPAVAIGIGSLSPMYVLAPVLGGIAAAWAYKLIAEKA